MERLNNSGVIRHHIETARETVVTSRAELYRRLARDFHFMARGLPPGENRSTLLKMAEECDHLADQQERPPAEPKNQFTNDCANMAQSKP